jgi:CopA family copper-resistance protein
MTKHETKAGLFSRRQMLNIAGAFGLGAALERLAPLYAITTAQAQSPALSGNVVDLVIAETPFRVGSRTATAMTINGTVPGPLVRLRDGADVTLNVTNRLKETSSIHWHGVLVPPGMDGVPGVSFGGIKPGETFSYRFPVRQSGTYWCHSHSGGQELLGVYMPLLIDPIEPEPFRYDRDYVILLSDWSFESPATIISKLKKQAGYFNYQKRTVGDFVRDTSNNGFAATFKERLSWSKMRMDPTDFADVTGYTYTYLLNGLTPEANWTGLFRPGETVRLRCIAAGAMTYFDVRIPGLKMSVVQADGQNVQPVEVDEFRIAAGETFDVLVHPEDRAYTLFAEAMDRSGYTRGTLAPRQGMSAAIPPRRPRPVRTMADMGMDMSGMEAKGKNPPGIDISGRQMQGMDMADKALDRTEQKRAGMVKDAAAGKDMPGMDMPALTKGRLAGPSLPGNPPVMHGPDTHGAENSSIAMAEKSRLDEPGSGFENTGSRVLVYADLKSVTPYPDRREPSREVELHITGNMERYMWSFDGKKYSEATAPIPFRYGERLRLVLVNDTMMEHPIHLHGMWMELENGAGPNQPRKHTISVKPAERLTLAITADAPGQWAMHCHLLLHMELGMFRVIEVSPNPEVKS